MNLWIIATGLRRELESPAADELIGRLRVGGIVQRDPATGEVIARSPMAELGDRLNSAREADSAYRPTEAEQGILFVVLDFWLSDVTVDNFPESAMTLRYALFADIDDRRRAQPASEDAS